MRFYTSPCVILLDTYNVLTSYLLFFLINFHPYGTGASLFLGKRKATHTQNTLFYKSGMEFRLLVFDPKTFQKCSISLK